MSEAAGAEEIPPKYTTDVPVPSTCKQQFTLEVGEPPHELESQTVISSDRHTVLKMLKLRPESPRIPSSAELSSGANGIEQNKEAECTISEQVQLKTALKELETVQISNADSSDEIPKKERKARLEMYSDPLGSDAISIVELPDEDGAEAYMPCDNNKASTSSELVALTEVSNDDLLAILEGDVDSTTAKPNQQNENTETIVFEVIEDADKTKTLSAEEVKKIALEQIRGISAKKRGRPPAAAKQADGGSLVSSLVSDWSDNDNEPAGERMDAAKPVVAKQTRVSPPVEEPVVVIKKESTSKDIAGKFSRPTVTSMKPTRIIKKKIIWDPDAPETKISYASLLKASPTPRRRKIPSVATSPVVQIEKIEQISLPAVKKLPEPSGQEAAEAAKPKVAEAAKPQVAEEKPKVVETKPKAVEEKPKPAKVSLVKSKSVQQPLLKLKGRPKRSTPSPANAVQSKRKRVSEIDKLLNDEGAANMLSTLETEKTIQKDTRARKTPTPTPPSSDNVPKKEAVSKKRPGRPSAASSWDYVYNQRNVDSLIIRRRSNSSYSSTTSPRRLSVEAKPVRLSKGKGKAFVFVKPDTKKSGKKSLEKDSEVERTESMKSASSSQESLRKSNKTPIPSQPKVTAGKSLKPSESPSSREGRTPEVTIKRHGNVVQMILRPKLEPIQNTFSVELMNEVVRQLDTLQADNSCKVLVMTSAGTSFCQGVDFSALTHGNSDKRKIAAQHLAGSVTSFLKALLTFPKPLVAGISGSCSGIGVTMLSAFDVVISSDKNSFEAPYAKIGQIPEGNCLLMSTNVVRHSFKVKLLWFCEKLTSTEAALAGLVTKLTAPLKVVDDTIQCAKRMATLSQQSLLAMKARKKLDLTKLIDALDEERKILEDQWQTAECLEKFKHYISKESW